MKLIPVILAGLLVLVAAGRYNAEADVRERRAELSQVKRAVVEAERDVAQVRLDVEVLESASRLSELNTQHLRLRTVRAEQLIDEQDFARIVGVAAPAKPRMVPVDSDVIGNAISMADMRLAARVAGKTGDAQ